MIRFTRNAKSIVRWLILASLLALLCFPAIAQRGFSASRIGARFSGRFASNRGRHARSGSYPLGPLFWDSLFSDDFADSEYSAPVQPVIVIQQPSAPPLVAAKPAEPLLIEWRGGQYVQIGGPQNSSEETQNLPPVPYAFGSHEGEATQESSTLPSTILIFRDGNREEIRDYTIADGILYAQMNYYTEGSWHKQISVSSLDLAATLNANRARGVRFQLPAAPNQVIVGP